MIPAKNNFLNYLLLILLSLAIGAGLFFFIPKVLALKDASPSSQIAAPVVEVKKEEEVVPLVPEVVHLPTPDPLKAIYMTSCVVGTPSFREKLVKVAETTEINSIIIDVKDFSGTLSFKPKNPELLHAWTATRCGAPDMKEFIKMLHEKNIYVIARVTVFQDPHYTKLHPELAVKSKATGLPWKDRKGIAFLDVGGKETWDYTIAIAKEAYEIGFDEINFDYIRYPSDGNMADTSFTLSTGKKADQLEEFFKYLKGKMDEIGVVTSADLFGMTTTNTDDLNIGQVLEKAMPYFDYIAPMVYPSHYPKNFNGWADPNKHVYDLTYYVMKRGADRAEAPTTIIKTIGSTAVASTTPQKYTKEVYPRTKLRTWIQDFDYGGTYGIAEVKAMIKASVDAGVTSYMIWAPSNIYTTGALLPETEDVAR